MRLNSNLLTLHVAVLLLGMTGLFGKFLELHPTAIIAGRSIFTALSIMVLMRFMGIGFGNIINREGLYLALSGVVLAAHWFAFFHAIQLSTVAIGVIGFSTYPVFVTFLEPLLFSERLRLMDILSGVLVFIGLLFVVPDFDISNDQTVALGWAVASGFILAVFSLMNRRLVRDHHFLVITFCQHATATVCTLPFVWGLTILPGGNEILLLVLLGVVFTAIPQALLVRSLAEVKAQLASVIVGLEPLYAILFAALLLQEIPSLSTLAGGAIILLAVWLAMKSHQPAAGQEEAAKTDPPGIH